MAAYLPLEVARNGVFGALLTMTDLENAPLDLTGTTFRMTVRYAAGSAGNPLLVVTPEIVDADAGEVEVLLDGRQLAGVPGPMEPVELAYDLIAIQGTTQMPLVEGPLLLKPGVS